MARIAVGGFQHETNTFAPLKASWEDFERADVWPPFVRGPQLIEAVEGFNMPIARDRDAAGAGPRCRTTVLVLGAALLLSRGGGLRKSGWGDR
jgi:microcystin degradation protein MlrC